MKVMAFNAKIRGRPSDQSRFEQLTTLNRSNFNVVIPCFQIHPWSGSYDGEAQLNGNSSRVISGFLSYDRGKLNVADSTWLPFARHNLVPFVKPTKRLCFVNIECRSSPHRITIRWTFELLGYALACRTLCPLTTGSSPSGIRCSEQPGRIERIAVQSTPRNTRGLCRQGWWACRKC